MNSTDTLPAALARHQISLPESQVVALDQYCAILWEWNEKLNLTRHTDYERFVARDVLDSWQLSKHLQADDVVLDVGAGGGVPGLMVAILRPDLHVSVCDSVGKKARVLENMVQRLKLAVPVYPQRAELVLEQRRFTAVTARAVGSLAKMCEWFSAHWPAIGRLLTIKGPSWVAERGEARHRGYLKNLELRKVAEYPMPGTESRSVILKVWPKDRSES